MTYVKRFKTLYMHTLDGQPASFDGKDYIYFASRRAPAMLVPSLRQIRREQQKEIARIVSDKGVLGGAAILERLDYIRVEIPL